jgi:hypothetical protein
MGPEKIAELKRLVELLAQHIGAACMYLIGSTIRTCGNHGLTVGMPQPDGRVKMALAIDCDFKATGDGCMDLVSDGGAIIAVGCEFDRAKIACLNGGVIIDVPCEECDLLLAGLEVATGSNAITQITQFADYIDLLEDEFRTRRATTKPDHRPGNGSR